MFSSESGESSLSRSARVGRVIAKSSSELQIFDRTFVVRKSAHFFLYFVLGVLVFWCARGYEWSTKKVVVSSVFLCAFYAVTDELHQRFTAHRSPSMRDVLIDTVGASIGILCFILVNKLMCERRTRVAS
jgi:VanZ family protein